MMSDDFEIVNVRGNGYRINFWFMTKCQAVDRMKNAGEKNGQL